MRRHFFWPFPGLALSLALTACGGDETVAQSAGAGQTAPAIVAPVFAPPSERWDGIATCAGRDYLLALLLSPPNAAASAEWTARLSFDEALNSKGYASPRGYAAETRLSGEYRAQVGLLELISTPGGRRSATLSLLLTPPGDAALATMPGCEFAVLAPQGSAHPVGELASELMALQDRPVLTEADMEGACPDALEAWIARGLELPLDDWGRGDSDSLWSDETAQAIFGRPWLDIGAEERQQIFRDLMGRCGERGNRRRGGVITLLARVANYREFRDGQMRGMGSAIAQRWLQGFSDLGAADRSGAEVSLADAQAANAIPRRFAFDEMLGEDFDAPGHNAEARALLKSAMAQKHNRDTLAALEAAASDFIRLTALYGRALQDPDIDHAAATAILAGHLGNAAEAYAHSATSPDAANSMLGWLAEGPGTASCSSSTKRACANASEHFEDRLDELSAAWSRELQEELDALKDRDADTGLLAEAIAWNRGLDARFGAVLAYGELAEVMEETRGWLSDLQEDLEQPLLAEVKATRTTPELRSLEARYFRPGDLQQKYLRRLRDAIAERRDSAQPFRDTGADEYLNALYNRDFAALRRLDAQLLAGVRAATGFMAQQVAMLDSLAAAATGTSPLRSVINELLSPSALRAAAVTYLLEYEERWGSCLGDNAVVFTFTERTDMVTRNAMGFELSRIEGVTTATRYRVKPSLAELFRDSFSSPPEAGSERIYSLLFGDDGVTRVTGALRRVMRDYDCDAPDIARLEAGMIAYQRELHRRWGGGTGK